MTDIKPFSEPQSVPKHSANHRLLIITIITIALTIAAVVAPVSFTMIRKSMTTQRTKTSTTATETSTTIMNSVTATLSATSTMSMTTTVSPDMYYYIQSRLNMLVLDLYQGLTDDGTPIVTWPPVTSSNATGISSQLWRFANDGTIENKAAVGKVIQPTSNSNLDLIIWPRTGSASQIWRVNGSIIYRPSDNKAIDIRGSNRSVGVVVMAYQAFGTTNQQWVITPELN